MQYLPKLRSLALLTLLGLVAIAPHCPAKAALIGDTRVPFAADRSVTLNNKTYSGRMMAVPGAERQEQTINGIRLTAILRADRRLAWLILPDMHLYAEVALASRWLGYADQSVLGPPLGHEQIAGREAARYRIERHQADGSDLDARLWLTPENILIRVDGIYRAPGGHRTAFSGRLSHIEAAPQDPALFEPPLGFTKLPEAALRPLLGLKGEAP